MGGESDEEVWQTTARSKVKTVETEWAEEAAPESNGTWLLLLLLLCSYCGDTGIQIWL